MSKNDSDFYTQKRRVLIKPKVVSDIQFSRQSVYRDLSPRVNLSFKEAKSFSFLTLFKLATVFSIITFLILGRTTAPTLPTFAADAAAEAERQALEAKLKDLESQIGAYQDQVAGYQKQGNSLKNEISKLNAKISQINLEIKENEYKLRELQYEMTDNQQKITQIEGDIQSEQVNLGAILRTLYQTDQTNLVTIFLKSNKFSDFFNDVNNLTNLQDNLRTTINKITDLKSQLESKQQDLLLAKNDTETLKVYKETQKSETDQIKSEKNQLLTVTKGQESKYQELLQKTKESAAQIRSRIFQLLGGGEMSFGDAYKLAKLAGDAARIRPAFLLAILDRESALGQNVGKCNYKSAMNPNPKRQPDGSYKSEVDLFLEITTALGLQNPESLSVSCPNADGPYGGAMGPAQFIPSTWDMYTAQISSVTGHNPPSPWNNSDAFAAAALYLKNAGAGTSERMAAAKYYCGGRWNRYVCTGIYAKKVLNQAAQFEDDIATLNQ